ncbi:hypothetical protein ACFL7M_05985 [Thermodesulfobacteriota bacterium]
MQTNTWTWQGTDVFTGIHLVTQGIKKALPKKGSETHNMLILFMVPKARLELAHPYGH